MRFLQLARYFQRLESLTSRNEITVLLAEVLKKAKLSEIDKICYLSLGRLGPLFEPLEFNIAEKMMVMILSNTYEKGLGEVTNFYKKIGDLGEVAYKLKITTKNLKFFEDI